MSELIESIEKSVSFLKEKYPADLPLLVSLQTTLKRLNREKETNEEKPPAAKAKR